jgi:hypothetical protein
VCSSDLDETKGADGVKHFEPRYRLEDLLDGETPQRVRQSIPSAEEMRRISGVVVR